VTVAVLWPQALFAKAYGVGDNLWVGDSTPLSSLVKLVFERHAGARLFYQIVKAPSSGMVPELNSSRWKATGTDLTAALGQYAEQRTLKELFAGYAPEDGLKLETAGFDFRLYYGFGAPTGTGSNSQAVVTSVFFNLWVSKLAPKVARKGSADLGTVGTGPLYAAIELAGCGDDHVTITYQLNGIAADGWSGNTPARDGIYRDLRPALVVVKELWAGSSYSRLGEFAKGDYEISYQVRFDANRGAGAANYFYLEPVTFNFRYDPAEGYPEAYGEVKGERFIHVGIAVGAGAGALVVVALVVATICIVRSRRRGGAGAIAIPSTEVNEAL
jgi:hypothetical protein